MFVHLVNIYYYMTRSMIEHDLENYKQQDLSIKSCGSYVDSKCTNLTLNI